MGINVLSLFDGMSCGMLALKRANIKVDNYYASEIDKYAIKVSKVNFPEIIHIGDITKFDVASIVVPIDLVIGGSPCQGFSFAGKQLNFDDVRSKLFFEYVRLLEEVKKQNPNVKFLLENVRMKQEYQDVISNILGVTPIMIDSSLISAQRRVRLYWTNIEGITQPEDKYIYLKDILEEGITDRSKSYCIDACYYKGGNLNQYFNKGRRQLIFKDREALEYVKNQAQLSLPFSIEDMEEVFNDRKAYTLAATTAYSIRNFNRGLCNYVYAAAQRGRNIVDGKRKDYLGAPTEQRIEVSDSGKSNCLTSAQKDSLVLIISEATKKGYIEVENGQCFDWTFPNSKTRRGRLMEDKSNCLTATPYEFMQYKDGIVRKLTPIECERLQTVPDGYTAHVSNSQRYKMLGNGWTIDVIVHILKNLK